VSGSVAITGWLLGCSDMPPIQVLAHAKINLALYVLGKRPDGYHDIATVLQLVTLHDTLTFDFDTSTYSFACSDPALADPESNSSARRCEHWRKPPGADSMWPFIWESHPHRRSLGGGSADAAVTLRTLNEQSGPGACTPGSLPPGSRAGVGRPFFLTSGQALAEGRGERLTELSCPTNYHVCIAFPGNPCERP